MCQKAATTYEWKAKIKTTRWYKHPLLKSWCGLKKKNISLSAEKKMQLSSVQMHLNAHHLSKRTIQRKQCHVNHILIRFKEITLVNLRFSVAMATFRLLHQLINSRREDERMGSLEKNICSHWKFIKISQTFLQI